jgi:hypothetical protein
MPRYQGDVFSDSAQLSFVLWVLGYLGCASIADNAASAVLSPTSRAFCSGRVVAPGLERIKNWIALRTNLFTGPTIARCCLPAARKTTNCYRFATRRQKPQASCESVFESCAVPLTKKLHWPNVTSRT